MAKYRFPPKRVFITTLIKGSILSNGTCLFSLEQNRDGDGTEEPRFEQNRDGDGTEEPRFEQNRVKIQKMLESESYNEEYEA